MKLEDSDLQISEVEEITDKVDKAVARILKEPMINQDKIKAAMQRIENGTLFSENSLDSIAEKIQQIEYLFENEE